MARPPAFAGMFYEAEPEALKKQLEWCFMHELGPGSMPNPAPKTQNPKLKTAIIAPHAGYAFSGPCAAHSYAALAETSADSYIILGTAHSARQSCISLEDYQTPLGTVEVDKELSTTILASTNLIEDASAQRREHSVEVQLPFLQLIDKNAKIVPILISDDLNPKKFARLLTEVIGMSSRQIAVIASGDMTHYGFSYGYLPFRTQVKEKMYALDRKALDFIVKKDAQGFLTYVGQTGATICGKHAFAVLAYAFPDSIARLLTYYTSGDILGDYTNAVGYASVVF